ncbi:MAG: hypothetical protein ACKO3I_10205 [Synechococcales cyanobacterium]|nr:hypothetical protein [Cyanobacteria bacterium REEB444]
MVDSPTDELFPSIPSNEPMACQEPVLCPHCGRTASNGVKCKGICVSDSNY